MSSQEDLVDEMIKTVDLLIDNAQEMEKTTLGEKELDHLQEKQEALIKKLVSLDAQIPSLQAHLQKPLKEKFAAFEQAHRKFFNRIKKELRLIYFEKD